MDSMENMVGLNVPVPSIPPALNNTGVVTIDDSVAMHLREKIEGADKKLKTDSFSPTNVALGAALLQSLSSA